MLVQGWLEWHVVYRAGILHTHLLQFATEMCVQIAAEGPVHPDYGRVRHINQRQWQAVQAEELGFWQRTEIPKGNELQSDTFQQFDFLPRDLGAVLEIGAGPYTKTFLMLQVELHVSNHSCL